MKTTYEITGMRSERCVEKVTGALLSVPEVKEAEVTLNPPMARMSFSSPVSLNRLQQAVARAGDYLIEEVREQPHAM